MAWSYNSVNGSLGPLVGSASVAVIKTNGTPEGARWEELTSYVAQQLWAGPNPRQGMRALESQGLGYRTALSLVGTIHEALRLGGAL